MESAVVEELVVPASPRESAVVCPALACHTIRTAELAGVVENGGDELAIRTGDVTFVQIGDFVEVRARTVCGTSLATRVPGSRTGQTAIETGSTCVVGWISGAIAIEHG